MCIPVVLFRSDACSVLSEYYKGILKRDFCQEMQIFFVDYCIFCPLRQHKGLKQCSGQILLSLGILQGNDKKVKLT